ncbi:peptidylprolyl isomerase [bacterium]|nr:peptidylprolyl isomerase [bacterium]
MKKLVLFFLTSILVVGCVKEAPKSNINTTKKEVVKDTKESAKKDVQEDKFTLPDIVASIGDEKITKETILAELEKIEAQFKRFKQHVTEAQKRTMAINITDNIIRQKLMQKYAKDNSLIISEDDINKEFEASKKRFKSEEDYQNFLKQHQLSEDKIKEEIKSRHLNKMVIEHAVLSKITVSEDSVKKYYDEHPAEFTEPEKIKARHILIKVTPNDTKEKHDEALKKINLILENLKKSKGKDFAEVAEKESEGPSKKNGGIIGDWIGRGQLAPEFEKAAFALKKGEMSEVVETSFGYHIIKLEDYREERKLSFDEEKKRIEDKIRMDLSREKVKEFFSTLKKDNKVEILVK